MNKTSNQRRQSKHRNYDDGAILAALSKMLNDNPSLEPAAAIKAMGITDQMSIKRLRGKIHAGAQAGKQNRTAASRGGVTAIPVIDEPGQSPAVQPVAEIAPGTLTVAAETNAPPVLEQMSAPRVADSGAGVTPAVTKALAPDVADRVQSPDERASHRPDAWPEPWFVTLGGASVAAWLSVFELQQVVVRETLRVLPVTTALQTQMMFCQWTMMAYGSQARPRNFTT